MIVVGLQRDPGFQVDRDKCSGRTVAPGGTCVVSVVFAPTQPDVTSTAALVFQTNTAEQRESVTLTGTSTKSWWNRGGDGPARDRS